MIEQALHKLRIYIEKEEFKGYDPNDILNSFIPLKYLGRYTQIVASQIQIRNPINLRPILGIKKGINPKGMGLLLSSYINLSIYENTDKYSFIIDYIFTWLKKNYSQGFSGFCWGYNYPWAGKNKILNKNHPSIVATSFVAKGIFDYYQLTKSEDALIILESICQYILKDLPLTETSYGICFSYTDVVKDTCFNASMLGAEVLAKVYSITKKELYFKSAIKATDFLLEHQHSNGMWAYSIELKSGKEDMQIDFHQGYVIDSLFYVIKFLELSDSKYMDALGRALKFYRNSQFTNNGYSKWRLPKQYPIETHHQAQGIITFSRLSDFDKSYLPFAEKLLINSINDLQSKVGYFYFRKYKFFKNKIPLMRWSQAFMMLAFTEFLIAKKNVRYENIN